MSDAFKRYVIILAGLMGRRNPVEDMESFHFELQALAANMTEEEMKLCTDMAYAWSDQYLKRDV